MAVVDPKDFPRDDLATKVATATVQVVFAYRKAPKDWSFQSLPLYGGLQEACRTRAEECTAQLIDLVARPYDPQWDLRIGEEYFYLSNDPPAGGNFFTQLPAFATFPVFRERGRLRRPNAWIVIAQLDDASLAYFGARIAPSAVLDSRSRALRVVYRGEAFDTLDDTVITFGTGFDWIAWKDVMIVLNHDNFHAMFRDIPALMAQIDANLATITQHVGIDNLDSLRERIRAYPGMMVKLQGIIDRADMHTRPPAVLRQYGIDYAIHIDWKGDSMVFDGSVERQWNILRLLDEVRTLGPVTGKKWDTSSKVEI